MILGQHVDCLVRNCALEPNETIEKMANFELIKTLYFTLLLRKKKGKMMGF